MKAKLQHAEFIRRSDADLAGRGVESYNDVTLFNIFKENDI